MEQSSLKLNNQSSQKGNKKHWNKKKMRKIISFLLSYLMSLTFTVLFLCAGIYAGVFNDSVILGRLYKSNYYQSIHTSIMNNVESIILPTGLEVSVLDDVITLEMVYIGAKNAIEGTLKGRTIITDTKGIKNKLRDNILLYAKENGILYGDEQKQGMDTLCKIVSNEYINRLEFPFIKYYVKYKALYLKILKITIPIIMALIVILVASILSIHRYKHQGVRYIAYSLLASTLMITILPMLILVSDTYRKLNISPKYFYNFMVSYLQWDITVFLYIGGIGAVIFGGLLILVGELKKKGN